MSIKERSEFSILLVYPNLSGMSVVPSSIGIFSNILKKSGFDVHLFDTTFFVPNDGNYEYHNERARMFNVRDMSDGTGSEIGIEYQSFEVDAFKSDVISINPDLIFFTTVEDTFEKTLSLLKSIEDQPITKLVGGVFPTFAPEVCINHHLIDFIGIGEGENTVLDVAEAVRLHSDLSCIRGTWFKDTEGNVHKNLPQPLINLNDVRADFSLFDEKRFWRPFGGKLFKTIPVETYRGCPYACTYCNSPGQRQFAKDSGVGHFLRRKKTEVLKDELEYYVAQYDPGFFIFIDDSFLARPREEIFQFCDMYEDFKIPFWFNTRAENCDAEQLSRLKEVGAYRMTFGLECGNEQYRKDVLKRNVPNKEYIEHFKIIAESGIPWNVNIIIGMPFETRDLVMDTVEFCREIKGYDSLSVSIFSPFRGTNLRKVSEEAGFISSDAHGNSLIEESILDMPKPYLNKEEISGLAKIFPLYCYFPKSHWPELRRAESSDETGDQIREYYGNIYKEKFLGSSQDSIKKEGEAVISFEQYSSGDYVTDAAI